MEFRLVVVGRIRDSGLQSLARTYAERTARYIPLTIKVCPEGKGRPNEVRTQEGRAILKAVPERSTVVALTREGKHCSSRRFATMVTAWHESARDTVFVVGGAFGLADTVIERADHALSLSAMTFPHELARVMLLEQLYRANTIRRGEPYHKGA